MKSIRVLYLGFFVVTMLVLVSSCGVPSPTEPTVTTTTADASTANASTINTTDPIVITFNTSMVTGSLALTGDMADESDRGVWSRTSVTNDTVTISPSIARGGEWTVGTHTLIVDVDATSGEPLPTLRLTYTVAKVPTATVPSSGPGPVLGSDKAIIIFDTAMDPSTLVLTGDMAVESDGGEWATTTNTNDTLIISPITAWTGNTNTLIVDVKSAAGVPSPTLTLTYIIDVTVPVAKTILPADTAVINNTEPVVISFTIAMKPATLIWAGTMKADGGVPVWSTTTNANDTLTISPSGAWTGGAHTLIIDVEANNTKPLATLTLNYTVDNALLINSVTPASGSFITGGESIIIDFGESVDIATLVASGSLWDKSDFGVWSATTTPNDTLTLSPATSTSWPVGAIDLTLDIADLVGNSLAPLNLNYTVDVTPPVITLLGSTPISVDENTVYVDAGATASDNIDGDITGSIIATSTVNTAVPGAYSVTYNVSDAAGNVAIVVRTVNVIADLTPPVITITAGTDTLVAGDTWIDAGATALDAVDGPVTAIVTSNNVTTAVGIYPVTYSATDVAGNTATADRTVTVTAPADVTPPVITITAGTDTLVAGDTWIDAGATALDAVDGPVTAIVTSNNVTTAVGIYTVTYSATDVAGNTATADRTVTVTAPADVTPPVITITAGTDTLVAGDTWIDAGATALDAVDGPVTAIVTSNNVTTAVGIYTVTYSATDVAGNTATADRTVTVTAPADVTPPVITITAGTDTLVAGDTWIDAGATALDAVDGPVTAIVTSNNVTTAVGIYTVTYSATDVAGNTATADRTVTVTAPADVTPPVITITAGTDTLVAGDTWIDAGATALDAVDGPVTAIVTSNNVTTAVGIYTVTYSATDVAGNTATADRTVTVTTPADVTPPVITITAGTDTLVAGDTWIDAGATALDAVDGPVTAIVTSNNVTTAVGIYTVTYSATDVAGNTATADRTVTVTAPADVTPPVITITAGTDTLVAGDTWIDAGATALDAVDGPVTAIVTSNNVTTAVGIYTVTYSATDVAGNTATADRTVTVTAPADVTPPVITITAGTDTLVAGDTWIDAGATALDAVDGPVTAIVTSNNVTTAVGIYTVTYSATDAALNTSTADRTVIVN